MPTSPDAGTSPGSSADRQPAAGEHLGEERGLIIVFTGNGKGKTTAAFGQALRAAGQGMRVAIIQFVKGSWPTGEEKAITALADRIEFCKKGGGFTWEGKGIAEHRAIGAEAWQLASEKVRSDRYELVVLDELTYLVELGVIDEPTLLKLLAERPARLHVVITGRGATAGLLAAADLVTEMREVKHPFRAGAKARKGIEF